MPETHESIQTALERVLRSEELIYTVDGEVVRLNFDGEPPTSVHLVVAGDVPAIVVHAPIRLGATANLDLFEWVIEMNRTLLYGRIDVLPSDSEPKIATVVFTYSILAEPLTKEVVGFLLALATTMSQELQAAVGDRFGGEPVFD
jgi:hypothetical protein